jgi:hypothetical protein
MPRKIGRRFGVSAAGNKRSATEFILETRSWRCSLRLVDPRADRQTKPLNFAAMLREDEGEGVLLTELVCQSDWSPTHMLPQPAAH